jgi:hypothetical protein
MTASSLQIGQFFVTLHDFVAESVLLIPNYCFRMNRLWSNHEYKLLLAGFSGVIPLGYRKLDDHAEDNMYHTAALIIRPMEVMIIAYKFTDAISSARHHPLTSLTRSRSPDHARPTCLPLSSAG